MERTAATVWGMGNPLLHDDAAGLKAAEILKEKYLSGLEGFSVRCVETVPANFISTLARERPLSFVLIDASDMGLMPGEIRRFPLSRLEESAFTSHDFPVKILLESALPSDCTGTIIAIQPLSCDLTPDELTPPVMAAAEKCARLIAEGKICDIEELD